MPVSRWVPSLLRRATLPGEVADTPRQVSECIARVHHAQGNVQSAVRFLVVALDDLSYAQSALKEHLDGAACGIAVTVEEETLASIVEKLSVINEAKRRL
jgi:hypothetical protein